MIMRVIKPSAEFQEQQREAKAIRKDISTARGIISDGIQRYKKKMLHARSKKQAEDLSVFAELDQYGSKRDIQDAYGYDFITEATMDRLNDLWDAREQYINARGQFEDRVSQMLTRAMNRVGDVFMETLEEFDALERRVKEDSIRIERENSANAYTRWQKGL